MSMSTGGVDKKESSGGTSAVPLSAAPPPPRKATQKKRPVATEKLTGDRAASEALRLLHNRLFGAIEESEGKARQEVQNETRDGYAKLLHKFGKGWSKAKRAEEAARVERELRRVIDGLEVEEDTERADFLTAEDARFSALELMYRDTTRVKLAMDARQRRDAAERDGVGAAEGAGRLEVEQAERGEQGVLEAELRASLADATQRTETRVAADRERRRKLREEREEAAQEALRKERRTLSDEEEAMRADLELTERYAMEVTEERWGRVLAAEARRRKLMADLGDLGEAEEVGREELHREHAALFDALPDLMAQDRALRANDAISRYAEERASTEAAERKAASLISKEEHSERKELVDGLQRGVEAFAVWVKRRKDQLAALVAKEETERRAALKEEYEEALQLNADSKKHYQNVLKILQAQKEADDRSLAEYLADAQNMQLQLEMLANKRKERTEQLKKEREVVVEMVAKEKADLQQGELELLLEKWVHGLEDTYLAIDAKTSAGESADAETQTYSSDKLMFAMQLSQFKRSHPNIHKETGPATRERMTKLIKPFLELLVRDGDTNRTNMTLMNTLLSDNLPIDLGGIIEEDRLLNDAAVDGSVSYVDAFLSRTDLRLTPEAAASIVTLGLNNPAKQILFAECFLRREFALHMMALYEDLAPIWQQFFFRCICLAHDGTSPGASQRNYVIQTMLGRMGSSVKIGLGVPSTGDGPMQGHTPITAICRRGDVEMFQILINKCDPQAVVESMVVPSAADGTTPLINSILANDEDAVRLLLQFATVRDQIRRHRSTMGTAEDVVEKVLETDEIIVEMVLECGAGGAPPDVLNLTTSTLGSLTAVQDLAASMSTMAPPVVGGDMDDGHGADMSPTKTYISSGGLDSIDDRSKGFMDDYDDDFGDEL